MVRIEEAFTFPDTVVKWANELAPQPNEKVKNLSLGIHVNCLTKHIDSTPTRVTSRNFQRLAENVNKNKFLRSEFFWFGG